MFLDENPHFTNASLHGVKVVDHADLSDFGKFWLTFLGCQFINAKSKKVVSKTSLFWDNPSEAVNMAKTLLIPRSKYSFIKN